MAPPNPNVVIAGYSNVIAGVMLTISFSITALAKAGIITMGIPSSAFSMMIAAMKVEGFFYMVAGINLSKFFSEINLSPGWFTQIMITFGGFFFWMSGWGIPSNVKSLYYIVPKNYDNFFDVAPYYGIMCFMMATLINQIKAGSPQTNPYFYGLLMFFCGAWTIGVFVLWGPMVAGGFSEVSGLAPIDTFTLRNYIAPIGSVFLTVGACIFFTVDDCLSAGALQLVSGYSNIIAGITLAVSFTMIALANVNFLDFFENGAPTSNFNIMLETMRAEGFFFMLAGTCLSKFFADISLAPARYTQIIITFGGFFFMLSGFGNPGAVISLNYIIPSSFDGFLNCTAFYGIFCFMLATLINQLTAGSPQTNPYYWGLTMFFCGAWTIGVFVLWGPMLAGGTTNNPEKSPVTTFWVRNWIAIVGAIFLTMGAFIFAKVDGIAGFEGPPKEEVGDDVTSSQVELGDKGHAPLAESS